MKNYLILFIILVQYSFPADSINIALYGKRFVKYVGSLPTITSGGQERLDTFKMNPNNLIDKNFFSVLAFPVGIPSNVGSSFGIELNDSVLISSIRIVNLGNNTISGFTTRIQAFSIYGSKDTVGWQKIYQLESNKDSAYHTAVITSKNRWKYFKIVIDSMDNYTHTVIAELEVYTRLDSMMKAITSLTFAPTQYLNGESVNIINWQTINLSPADKINLYYKSSNSEIFKPLALNENNDGSFSWNTTFLSDGNYTVQIEPVVSGEKFGLTSSLNVQNYKNLSVSYNEKSLQYYTDISYFYSTTYLKDSITLNWKFSTQIKKDFKYQPVYSLDSGKSWVAITTINDSSKRNYTWKIPELKKSALYCMFGVDIYIDTIRMARIISNVPRIIIGGWPFASTPWMKRSDFMISYISRASVASFKTQSNSEERIVFSHQWVTKGNGDSSEVPLFNSLKSLYPIAVSDINGDGLVEIISNGVVSETGKPLFYDTSSTFGSDPIIIDVDDDGKKEIIYHKNNGFTVVSSEGKLLRIISVPTPTLNSYNIVSVADMNGDGQKDYVYGLTGYNSIYAFNQSGVGIAGYPITVSDIIRSSPLVADLNNNGNPNIIVAAKNNIFCFDKAGNLLNGFPYTVQFDINAKSISIADIDNDGYLDIIFTATKPSTYPELRITQIHSINRLGKNIDGWPITCNDNFSHYEMLQSYDPNTGENILVPNPRTFFGSFSSPYILSIDGDGNNEVVFFNSNGFIYAYDRFGNTKSGFPAFVGSTVNISAHFGDFDNNGTLNAIVPVVKENRVYMMNLDFGTNSYNSTRMPWPTDRQNVERTGMAPQAKPYDPFPIPEKYILQQNYPNPFNPKTTITFGLAKGDNTTLKIYDLLGREAATLIDGFVDAGTHSRDFSSTQLNSGVYFYTLRSGNFTETKKMMILK